METSVLEVRVHRGFGAVAGVALLVATAAFLPFIYLMILVVVFRSGYFLRSASGSTQRGYRVWVWVLVVWMVLLGFSIFRVLLQYYYSTANALRTEAAAPQKLQLS